jgi:membrane protein involved in colicin uptake
LGNDPANTKKPGEWFLKEAHKRVKAIHGIADKKTAGEDPAKAAAAKAEADKKAKEESDRKVKEAAIAARKNGGKMPTTLGGVPSAGENDLGKDNEGEFAHLNGLNGMDLEVAVAGMTPEQQDRWARL